MNPAARQIAAPMLELTRRQQLTPRRGELRAQLKVLFFDEMNAIPTVRLLICAVTGVYLFFAMASGLSAPDHPNTTPGMAEVEQRMEQLPTTPGMAEVEQSQNASSGESSGADANIAEDTTTAQPSTEENTSARIKAHDRFLFLYDQGRFREASAVVLEVVELTREEFGSDHIKMVSPLVNLAITQTKIGQFQAAEANYKTSIEIIEEQEGVLSPRLINSLRGLGNSYNRAGSYEQAVSVLERALLINHVNEGFYNFEQFKIQDSLTDGYSGMNALEDATFYKEAQVEIYERKLGADHPDIAISLYKLAKWYELINNTEEALLAYRKADRILRKAGGDTNSARVEALEGIAHIYERQALPSSTASALKKALNIIDSQPEPDLLQRARILIALGDLYTRQAKFETSESNYVAAWEDLSGNDKYLDQRDEYFDEPVRVSGGPFSKIDFNSRNKPADSLKDGHVLVSYAVTEKGRAREIRVIESEPPGLMDRSITSTYQRSLYRPRRVKGVAVQGNNRTTRHEFKYFKSLQEKKDAEARKSSEDSNSNSGRIEHPDKSD